MKRIMLLCVLLIVLVSCGGAHAGESAAPAANGEIDSGTDEIADCDLVPDEKCSADPAIWQVSSGGETIWLFGTVGVGDECFFTEKFSEIFNLCDTVAVESGAVSLDGDVSAQIEMLKIFVYKNYSAISAHIPDEIYTDARDILTESGDYTTQTDYYLPVMWYRLIDQAILTKSKIISGEGATNRVIAAAEKYKKNIVECGSWRDSCEKLAGLSESTQGYLLEKCTAEGYSDNYISQMCGVLDAWRLGDAEKLEMLLLPEIEEGESGSFESEYRTAAVTCVTDALMKSVRGFLSSGENVLFCVGCMNLLGDDGIIARLGALGYDVTRIS